MTFRSSPTAPLASRFRHHLLHRGFSLRPGLGIVTEVAHLRGFPLIQHAILACLPPLCLGGCRCYVGQRFEPARADLSLILGLLLALLRSCRHVPASWWR